MKPKRPAPPEGGEEKHDPAETSKPSEKEESVEAEEATGKEPELEVVEGEAESEVELSKSSVLSDPGSKIIRILLSLPYITTFN